MEDKPRVYLREGWLRGIQTLVYDHAKSRPMTAEQYRHIERRPRPTTPLDIKRLQLWLGWLEFIAERPRR